MGIASFIFAVIFAVFGVGGFIDLGINGFRASRLIGAIGFTLMTLGAVGFGIYEIIGEEPVGLAIASGLGLGVGFVVTIIAVGVAKGERSAAIRNPGSAPRSRGSRK